MRACLECSSGTGLTQSPSLCQAIRCPIGRSRMNQRLNYRRPIFFRCLIRQTSGQEADRKREPMSLPDKSMGQPENVTPGFGTQRPGWQALRPTSKFGCLVWFLLALLFFLLIRYVLVSWWYRPIPTDIPLPPASNTRTT